MVGTSQLASTHLCLACEQGRSSPPKQIDFPRCAVLAVEICARHDVSTLLNKQGCRCQGGQTTVQAERLDESVDPVIQGGLTCGAEGISRICTTARTTRYGLGLI